MERWKPENLETYWSVLDTTPMHFAWQGNPLEIARWEAGNVFKTHDQALIASIKVKSLLLSLHTANDETLKNKPLPKLTAEVFDLPDCPEWAKYAAVDQDGAGVWFASKTSIAPCGLWWDRTAKYCLIGHFMEWDASDWQNSLIERPSKAAFDKSLKNYAEEQANKILQIARKHRLSDQYHNGPEEENTLPEWVEVGGYVFDPARGYGKIISGSVNTCHIQFECMEASFLPEDFAGFKQARLRPYNAEEIPKLPFEVSEINSDFRTSVVSCKGDKIWLAGASTAISTEELMRDFDCEGFPCGVLEHLENGEWVE